LLWEYQLKIFTPLRVGLRIVLKEMPTGQVSDIFTNIIKVAYLMQITDFLKVNIKIEAI